MMLESVPNVLNVDELAVLLRIGRSAAYELLRSGRLRSVKIGNRIIITKNALRFLRRGALAWALRQELVARNVAIAVETPQVPRGTAVALSVDEAKLMLSAGDETRWGPFIRLALGCGARRGELLALQWTDIDIEGQALTIRGSLSQTRAGITEKPTKTDRVRLVALPNIAIEALERQAATQATDRRAAEGISWTAVMSSKAPLVAASTHTAQPMPFATRA